MIVRSALHLWVIGLALGLASAPGRAATIESAIAAYDLGDYTAAYAELLPLAQRDNPTAAYLVSRMLLAGQGITRNTDEGIRWLRFAAARGHAEAQVQLGQRYELGLGIVQSDSEAIRWYRQAAESGSPVGQLYLGMAYTNGRGGTPVDLVTAHMWLNLATAALPPGAVRTSVAGLRDAVTAQLTPEEIAQAHARARDWKPARAD